MAVPASDGANRHYRKPSESRARAQHGRGVRAFGHLNLSSRCGVMRNENTLIRARSPRDTMRAATMSDVQTEVFRSAFRAECMTRIHAGGGGHLERIGFDRDSYILTVDARLPRPPSIICARTRGESTRATCH